MSSVSSPIKIPPLVSRLMPAKQLEHALQYYGVYTETIERLYKVAQEIPKLGDGTVASTIEKKRHTANYSPIQGKP